MRLVYLGMPRQAFDSILAGWRPTGKRTAEGDWRDLSVHSRRKKIGKRWREGGGKIGEADWCGATGDEAGSVAVCWDIARESRHPDERVLTKAL
jgi:hypothetical protein